MRKITLLLTALTITLGAVAQGPSVTSWLQNTTTTGTYYVSGNSTPLSNGILVNCQQVEYSTDYVYVTTEGVPAYPTGPFQDGNPSNAESQGAIFKFPIDPQPNTGSATSTTMGTIGVFINGTSLYDYRDGVAWDNSSGALCGGPGNSPCPGGPQAVMDWNRDAIPAEMEGFDCSKGHPAMGNYHHHQNPSAFDLDLNLVSTICNLYDADGLYTIDSTVHSPLIGFAYDGYPIYGAYGYANNDGSGGIVRIKSGYQLQNLTNRTDGPTVSSTYFLGYFREDYEFVTHPGDDQYLDEHNGRDCVTPEYPNGTYAYFATVDENWNSAYPYVVGPTFYGVYGDRSVGSVGETTTIYTPATASWDCNGGSCTDPGDGSGVYSSLTACETACTSTGLNENEKSKRLTAYPIPGADLIAVQMIGVVRENLKVDLLDLRGRLVATTTINQGATMAHFDTQTIYEGVYIIRASDTHSVLTKKIMIAKE